MRQMRPSRAEHWRPAWRSQLSRFPIEPRPPRHAPGQASPNNPLDVPESCILPQSGRVHECPPGSPNGQTQPPAAALYNTRTSADMSAAAVPASASICGRERAGRLSVRCPLTTRPRPRAGSARTQRRPPRRRRTKGEGEHHGSRRVARAVWCGLAMGHAMLRRHSPGARPALPWPPPQCVPPGCHRDRRNCLGRTCRSGPPGSRSAVPESALRRRSTTACRRRRRHGIPAGRSVGAGQRAASKVRRDPQRRSLRPEASMLPRARRMRCGHGAAGRRNVPNSGSIFAGAHDGGRQPLAKVVWPTSIR